MPEVGQRDEVALEVGGDDGRARSGYLCVDSIVFLQPVQYITVPYLLYCIILTVSYTV